MEKKQIIIESDIKRIDGSVKHILVEPYYKEIANEKKLGNDYEVLKDPFPTDEDYYKATRYIVDLTERIIESIGNTINEYYEVSYSNRQWMVILVNWVHFALFDLYYRYLKLIKVDPESCYVYVPVQYNVELKSVDSTRNTYRSERKNAFLWGYVADEIGIETRKYKTNEGRISESQKKRIRMILRDPKRITRFIKRKNEQKAKKKDGSIFHNIDEKTDVLLFMTLLKDDVEETFVEKSNGRIGRLDIKELNYMNEKMLVGVTIDRTERTRTFKGKFEYKDSFEKMAYKYIISNLPAAYFERVKFFSEKSDYITNKWALEKIYTAYASNELMDFCTANMVDKGAKICEIQHTGAYGGKHTNIIGESLYADRFLSWGWTYNQFPYVRAEIKPVAITRLPQKAERKNHIVKSKILLACNYLVMGDGGQGWNMSDYIENQIDFIDALSEENKRKLVIRIDPMDKYNMELVKRCKRAYPSVRIENRYKYTFSDSVLESEVVICDYYGSTQFEALMLGVPFMYFPGEKIRCINPAFEEYYKVFLERGIAAKNGMQLAENLNNHKDFRKWLESDENNQLFTDYMNKFIGANMDINELWYKEFMSNY